MSKHSHLLLMQSVSKEGRETCNVCLVCVCVDMPPLPAIQSALITTRRVSTNDMPSLHQVEQFLCINTNVSLSKILYPYLPLSSYLSIYLFVYMSPTLSNRFIYSMATAPDTLQPP